MAVQCLRGCTEHSDCPAGQTCEDGLCEDDTACTRSPLGSNGLVHVDGARLVLGQKGTFHCLEGYVLAGLPSNHTGEPKMDVTCTETGWRHVDDDGFATEEPPQCFKGTDCHSQWKRSSLPRSEVLSQLVPATISARFVTKPQESAMNLAAPDGKSRN